MEKMRRKTLLACLTSVCLLMLASCTEEGLDTGDAALPSVGGPGTVPEGGVGDASGFWVYVASDQHPVVMSTSAGFGNDCLVATDETGNEFLTCYVDVLEGDLFVYNLDLLYNAAPGMCEHVTVSPAWHWNQSFGVGPNTVEVDVDASTAVPTVTSCTAWDDNTDAMINCNVHPELTDVANTSGPSCVYDKSGVERPNCCFGDYQLTINTDDGTDVTTSVANSTWGGDISSCFGGAVKTSWSAFNFEGFPVSTVEAVPEGDNGETTGLNGSISLIQNASSGAVGFSTMANFYKTTGAVTHTHTGYVETRSTNLPYAVDPVDDLDGTDLENYKANDSWVFACQDEGHEIIHVIRVYIREWNTVADFIAWQDSEGTVYDPDVTGTEGNECDYFGVGDSCNDFLDLDDLLPGAGYDVSSPNATVRESYFPYQNY